MSWKALPLILAAMMSVSQLDVAAEPSPAAEKFALELSEGVPIDEFLGDYARMTGKRLVYDSRRLANKRITGIGNMSFPVEDAERVFRSILMANGVAVLQEGPERLNLYRVEDIKTSQGLKDSARHVSVQELHATERWGDIVAVTVPLKRVDIESAQRALNGLIQEHRSSFVKPVKGANALVIVSFWEKVCTMVDLLDDLEEAAGN